MQLEIGINKTEVFNVNSCYKIPSYVLGKTPSTLCALFNIFFCFLSAITVCGNLLVIFSIIYFKQLHTPTNALILSLAVADLLVGALVFPLTKEFSITSCVDQQHLFCKVRISLDITLSTCSVLNLCCISIDRYFAVCQPLTYKTKMTNYVIVIMIFVSWGLPAVVAIGFIGFNRVSCAQNCIFSFVFQKILLILVTFYVPLLVMICLYLRIFVVAQKQAHSIHSMKNSGAAVSKMERKATKTLSIVVGVFLLCWLPSYLCTTILSFSGVPPPGFLVEALNWLALSNSMFNPLIYALFYSWFRSAFRMIVTGKIFLGDFTNTKLL